MKVPIPAFNITSYPDILFHVVTIDMVRPLPNAIRGHWYILISVDHLTK